MSPPYNHYVSIIVVFSPGGFACNDENDFAFQDADLFSRKVSHHRSMLNICFVCMVFLLNDLFVEKLFALL